MAPTSAGNVALAIVAIAVSSATTLNEQENMAMWPYGRRNRFLSRSNGAFAPVVAVNHRWVDNPGAVQARREFRTPVRPVLRCGADNWLNSHQAPDALFC